MGGGQKGCDETGPRPEAAALAGPRNDTGGAGGAPAGPRCEDAGEGGAGGRCEGGGGAADRRVAGPGAEPTGGGTAEERTPEDGGRAGARREGGGRSPALEGRGTLAPASPEGGPVRTVEGDGVAGAAGMDPAGAAPATELGTAGWLAGSPVGRSAGAGRARRCTAVVSSSSCSCSCMGARMRGVSARQKPTTKALGGAGDLVLVESRAMDPAMTSVTDDDFKRAMGSFAAGVTVVTTMDASGRAWGLTATAFTSVSLRPPLCLVCVDRRAGSLQALYESRKFAVSLLARGQEELSQRFASRAEDKFAGVGVVPGPVTGCPLLEGALGALECEVVHLYPGGDHDIVVGELRSTRVREDGEPLLYWRGKYAGLG
jgi:flavin reductase (DIM6/NTAB) family NADH-FMN oxidoreductase RutF